MARPASLTAAALPLLVLGLLLLAPPSRAAVPCNGTDADVCAARLWPGSTCRAGMCTNPLRSGCLRALFASDRYNRSRAAGGAEEDGLAALRDRLQAAPRACNSEDAEDDAGEVCTRYGNDYPEVRVWAQNWESGIILAWIMQIVYSELLNVPSTIETGTKDKSLNFYDEENSMGYGKSNEYAMFQNAHDEGNCSVYREGNAAADAEDYKPCAHLVMDVWSSNAKLEILQKADAADTMDYTGMVAFNGWHITQFSLDRDPSLASHFGLAGEEHRAKLAERFKRPMTWGTYCRALSSTNCTVADGVATRPPATNETDEAGQYFLEGAYTGFFNATEKNDCCEGKCNCTGHFMDYPCGWTSYVKQQTKHLGIALESDGNEACGGYSYGKMVEIWKAANATKSDLIGMWWTPDTTAKLLVGSGSDLTPVMLPAVRQVCVDNRVDILKRCDANATEFDIYGDEKGACGEPSMFTQKGSVGEMQQTILTNPNPKAQMSPAYDAFKEFSITDLEVDEILSELVDRNLDPANFDLRFATCQYVADNLADIVEKLVPPSHPRAFVDTSAQFYQSATTIVALLFSIIAILSALATAGCVVYKNKQATLGRGAQFDFMMLTLAGLFLIALGSLLLALEPTKGTCVGAIWMLNVGYATQLVSIMVCVGTILTAVRASAKMKIININRMSLIKKSLAFIGIALVFSAIWTVLSPPDSVMNLHITDKANDLGETIVSVAHYCRSSSTVWDVLFFVIHGFLLVWATALAYQMRSAPSAINNSREISVMIYSSVIFLALRILVFCLSELLSDGSLGKDYLQKARSLLFSLDTIANIVIYFMRYFKSQEKSDFRSSGFHSTNGWNTEQRGVSFAPSPYESRVSFCSSTPVPSEAHHAETPQALAKSADAMNESFSFSSEDKNQVGPSDRSVISVEEEKEEEASPTVRFRMKDTSVTLPKWVVEKYGETEVHKGKDETTVKITEENQKED